MTDDNYLDERHAFLRMAFSNNPRVVKILNHYGSSEVDAAERHISQLYERGLIEPGVSEREKN